MSAVRSRPRSPSPSLLEGGKEFVLLVVRPPRWSGPALVEACSWSHPGSWGRLLRTDEPRRAYPGMIRCLAVVTAFTALALPAAAVAKEPVRATVCGATGCGSSN